VALDSKAQKAAAAIADVAAEANAPAPVDESEVGHSKNGRMVSPEYVSLAKKLPEKDPVQKAIKEGMLAKNPHAEHKAKVKVVKASPDSEDTPSGAALVASEDIADDDKRAAAYTAVKTAMRHGVLQP
jgi:translation elongation factor EF-G